LDAERFSVAPDGTRYPIPDAGAIRDAFAATAAAAARHREAAGKVVVVQGLGFVGAAVAAAVAAARDKQGRALYYVIGVDLAAPTGWWKVARIAAGQCPVASPDPELPQLIARAVREDCNLAATASEAAYALADFIIVDVPFDVLDPTEVAPARIKINRGAFESAVRVIGRHMMPDALVLVETTVPVGATELMVLPTLEEERTRRGISSRPLVAHAYERVMPGPNCVSSINRFWRTCSGVDQRSAEAAAAFLATFIDTGSFPLTRLADPASSELAKLLENSYRAANIAFIYEWTLAAERLGIDLFAVIDSIRVRKGTHDNIRFPGFGVGGYCLTKDSLLAQWSLTNLYGSRLELKMTMEAVRTNQLMPLHTLELLKEVCPGGLADRKVAVLGVSYLPEVPDTRNSPTGILYDALVAAGAKPALHDPSVAHWPERPGTTVSQDLPATLKDADAVVLAVPHKTYLGLDPAVILGLAGRPFAAVDAQNLLTDAKATWLHEKGCRAIGVGKGHWRKQGLHLIEVQP
jgi:UDP-N-acetyl-D-glucosamine dehydrogenase